MKTSHRIAIGIAALALLVAAAADTLVTQKLVVQQTSNLAVATATSLQTADVIIPAGQGVFPTITPCNGGPGATMAVQGSLCIDPEGALLWQNTDGTNSWTSLASSSAIDVGAFGDASDGSQVFDGTTAVLGVTPVGGVYLLTRDVYLNNATINAGVTVHTGNNRFYVRGMLTLNGLLSDDGEGGRPDFNGFGGNGGTGCCQGHYGSTLCPVNASLGSLPFNVSGGPGGSQSSGGGTNGSTGTAAPRGMAGRGGDGGTGIGVKGTGGNTSTNTNLGDVRATPFAMAGVWPHAPGNTLTTGSGGGGGGGGNVVNQGGGGGGASGCWLAVAAKHWTGTGSLSARGGDGGNAGGPSGGGGGGGQGGICVFVTTDPTTPTCDVSGGSGGGVGTLTPLAQAGATGLKIMLPGTD